MEKERESAEPLLSNTNTTEKSAISKLNKILFPIFYITTILSLVDRSNLNYAANQICTALNLTNTAYGTGASLFYITLVIFCIPSNFILRKVGAPIWLGFLTFSWGLTAASMAFIKNKTQYYIIRLILGITESGTFPGMLHYIGCMYPQKYSTFVFSIIASSSLIATPVSAPLAAGLLSLDNFLGFDGWQWLFMIEGLIPMFFSFVIVFVLPKNIDSMSSLKIEEKIYLKNLIGHENDINETRLNKRRFLDTILELMKIKDYWILSMTTFVLFAAYNTILYFITLIVSTMLNDVDSVVDSETCSTTDLSVIPTLLSAIPYIFSAIIPILIGKYISYIKNRSYYLSFNCFIGSCSFAAWTLFQNNLILGLLFLTLAICTAFSTNIFVIFGMTNSYLNKDKDLNAVGFALFITFSNLSGIFGPLALGYIIDYYGYTAAVLSTSGVVLIVSGMFILVKENYSHIKNEDIDLNSDNTIVII